LSAYKKAKMAKLGESDPRWIVAERKDGSNVNSWHWDQKDKTKVCEQRLKDLFKGRVLYECPEYQIVSKELTDFEGDVTIANRKGKLRCFFEVKFTLKWSAMEKGASELDSLIEGKMIVNDCDTQNYVDNYDITVNTETKSPSGIKERALQSVQGPCRVMLRNVVKEFVDNDMMAANGVESAPMISKSTTTINKVASDSDKSGSPTGPAKGTTTPSDGISFKITWYASLQDIYECFTNEAKISAFTRAPCSMKVRVCGDFSMLGGAITGTFIELVEKKRIVMKWRLSSWKADEGTNSVVTIDFEGSDGNVTMSLHHAGVPASEYDRVKQGWDVNFWGGMKQILGYGNNQ
jgi:activator of HSP90 ATPase